MLYISTIFIGAFLLFQVQPFIAKILLPFFGGGASVWTACLLFFQGALFVGYLYAHLITQIPRVRTQAIIHISLLLLSLWLMPSSMVINSSDIIENYSEVSPLWGITLLLANTIGLPYLLLSATGPLLQRWLSFDNTNKAPYKLYAVSNLASLLALLSYPFFIEPLLAVNTQGNLWRGSYWLFVIVISAIGLHHFKRNKIIESVTSNSVTSNDDEILTLSPVNQKVSIFLWGLLAAIGVMFLVATTNAMTQNIPPVPFLWIVPLSLYLLSFILCFHSPKCYVRWYWFILFSLSAFAATLMFFIGSQFTLVSQLVIYSFILMSACMLCHGELARLKPAVNKLTLYYLMLSLGGFLGSLFVNLVAPYLFIFFLEFLIAIWALFLAFTFSVYIQKQNSPLPNNAKGDTFMARVSIGLMLVLIVFYLYLNGVVTKNTVASERNFYGLLSVVELNINEGDTNVYKERRLIDGTTSHGTQLLDPNFSQIPQSYYRKNTGVALALEHLYTKPDISVGLIGLGAGTLASYANKGDSYYFYELNPAVESMAKNYFSYLSNAKGYVDVTLGDGRVSLKRELNEFGSNQYQVLVIDAFSGDAIPSHLLTVEAFELYWKHLVDNGVLAIHISNSHLDLSELVRGLAKNSGKQALSFITPATKENSNEAHWVVITNNKRFINHRKIKALQTVWPKTEQKFTLWTDNYSNLLSVLK